MQGDVRGTLGRPFRTIVLGLVLSGFIGASVVAVTVDRPTRMIESRATSAPSGSSSSRLRAGPGTNVLVIGDSYALGVGASGQDKSWAALLSHEEQWNTTVDAVGGTGFVWGGGASGADREDYASRIAQLSRTRGFTPDLVLLEGGQNDLKANDEQLTRAVTISVRMVRAVWPSAQVVVMGPAAPEPLSSQLARLNRSIERAALRAGAYSINPRKSDWFNPDNSGRMNYEGSHVNDAGHALIAEKTEEAISRFSRGDRSY